MTRLVTALVATLLLVGSVAAAPPFLAIDTDHGLTQQSAIERFQTAGVVTTNLTQIAMSVTIAKSSGKAGLEGFHTDLTKTYLCLDYDEGLARELRLYIPAAYFEPRPATLTPVGDEDGPPATLEQVRNATYTAVTITFDGAARYCYAVRWETGAYFGGKGWLADLTENATGFELPNLRASPGSWTPIPAERVAANTSVALPESLADPAVQYDASPGSETRWVNVPECSDPAEQPICRFERHNRTHVMSTSPPHPTVRYRAEQTATSTIDSAINDALAAVDRIRESLGEWFGGDDA